MKVLTICAKAMESVSFHNKRMTATQTAPNGVVNEHTIFSFRQFDTRILASYAGGKVKRGMLVGKVTRGRLLFSYAQEDMTGKVQGGASECQIRLLPDGRIQLLEHFEWPDGKGLNVIEECS